MTRFRCAVPIPLAANARYAVIRVLRQAWARQIYIGTWEKILRQVLRDHYTRKRIEDLVYLARPIFSLLARLDHQSSQTTPPRPRKRLSRIVDQLDARV